MCLDLTPLDNVEHLLVDLSYIILMIDKIRKTLKLITMD